MSKKPTIAETIDAAIAKNLDTEGIFAELAVHHADANLSEVLVVLKGRMEELRLDLAEKEHLLAHARRVGRIDDEGDAA